MRILVDAMGGDLAPDEIVKGAVHAQQELGAEIVLVGQRAAIEACLRNEQAKLEIIDASEVITMDDDPSTATRRKKDASMTVALNMLRDGKGDAVVSAGSTGSSSSAFTASAARRWLPFCRTETRASCSSTAAPTPTARRSICCSLPIWAAIMPAPCLVSLRRASAC